MNKPLIVYISGAPGSGKTTLAEILSEQLYVPRVSSDLIHGGVALTQPAHNRQQTLLNIFVPTIIDMAQKGISVVVDHVLQKGMSDADIIEKIRPYGDIVYVHTQATDPIERYTNRVQRSTTPSVVERREHMLELAPIFTENLAKTSNPLELNLPSIVVNTDDGYDPSIKEIVTFIKLSY